jgi:fructuronate reductase
MTAMKPRLSDATLDALPASVERPGYDRAGIEAGVVHLGPGVFHRAHQATLFDDVLRTGDRRWGVIGASLRSTATHEAMTPQDGLYSLVVGGQVRVIGAIRQVLTPADPIIERLTAPETRLVTLTVTAKGYRPGEPAPRLIAEALALRRARGLDPFTAISCDDLPGNGAALRAAVLAEAADPKLADWIRERGAFPQTLADRIAPTTQEADIERLAARIGIVDRAMVTAEPFRHWVIEDWFAGERPDFEAAGVQLAFDIGPWQEAKARLLGGARLTLALLGGLAGYDYVHEIFAEPAVRRFVAALWDEAESSLSPPPGLDIAAYRDALAARFADPALEQRNRHAAANGARELVPNLLGAAAARLKHGQPIEALALGVAAWMRWQSRHTDVGMPFVVVDPLAGETARALVGAGDPTARAKALLKVAAVFAPALAADTRFEAAVTRQLKRLSDDGALRAVQRFVAELDA